MILLLPDFIGHPGCFQQLLPNLAGPVQCLNYHTLPLAASLPEMADNIAAALEQTPDWIIGYSFGGALGYELCHRLPSGVRLAMVDSHLPWPALRETPASEQYQRWLTAETRDWIALMDMLNEIRLPVILNTIALFSHWQPKSSLQQAWWVRCTSLNLHTGGEWSSLIPQLQTFDSTSQHHDVMKDPDVISYLTQLTHEVTLP